MNDIPRIQNEEPQQRLLWARRELFARGKLVLSIQLLLTVVVPVIGAVVAAFVPALRPYVAFFALIVAILDSTVVDRWHRNLRRTAAKMQEQFDTTVLQLHWDDFTAGDRVARELIHGLSKRFNFLRKDEELIDWYPVGVRNAPLYLARIICQRSNLWYDAELRRGYARLVLGLSIALTVFLLFVAMLAGLTVESLVLSVLSPATPIVIWGLREFFRQKDSADRLDRLLTNADRLWERARKGGCSEPECMTASRQFQNAIYEHRSSSPLTFSWLYRLQRSSLEERMNRAAEDMVKEIDVP